VDGDRESQVSVWLLRERRQASEGAGYLLQPGGKARGKAEAGQIGRRALHFPVRDANLRSRAVAMTVRVRRDRSAFHSRSPQRDHDGAEVGGKLHTSLWTLEHHRDAFVVAQLRTIDAADQGNPAPDRAVRTRKIADLSDT
jgi:hypothetical protein